MEFSAIQDTTHTTFTMIKSSALFCYLFAFSILFTGLSCKQSNGKTSAQHDIASNPQELQQKNTDQVRSFLQKALDNKGRLDDSLILRQPALVQKIYEKNNNAPLWSKDEKWLPAGDSMYNVVAHAQLLGLFPEDYHGPDLVKIFTAFQNDSTGESDRKDAMLWSRADLMLTDAFVQVLHDVKTGRIPGDSITLRKDSLLKEEDYLELFSKLQQGGSLAEIIHSVEPHQRGYFLIKAGIQRFLDSADFKAYTVVPSPLDKNPQFRTLLQKRLFEGGYLSTDTVRADSATLVAAIKKFQNANGIQADGVAGGGTVRMLNLNDREKFIRIAISMDRYKLLPDEMPEKYIWVNLPAFRLDLIDSGRVVFNSKVICGKPDTRTPLLTSNVSELITYPQWVPPPSIIAKEILPAVKKSPGYLAKKGFTLVDSRGDEIDPYSVDWTKYNKTMPYHVVQGSGDANALGIMKFNFPNKYSVYLHDTNQRYLFGQTFRAMSHGCVRVQEWNRLSDYIIRNDRGSFSGSLPILDSVQNWLKRKQKHSVGIRNKFPLFIRYFTCEGRDGRIVFFDDIYGEDKWLRKTYFPGK